MTATPSLKISEVQLLRKDMEILRKDMETMRMELSAKIESSTLRVESNLKSEINKLKVWIIAAMFGVAALSTTLGKLFFDK